MTIMATLRCASASLYQQVLQALLHWADVMTTIDDDYDYAPGESARGSETMEN